MALNPVASPFLLLSLYEGDTGDPTSISNSLWMRFPGIVVSCTDSSLLSLAWLLLCLGLQRSRPCVPWLSCEGKEIRACPLGRSATQTFRNRETVLKSKMNAGNLGWWSLQRNLSKRRCPAKWEEHGLVPFESQQIWTFGRMVGIKM